MGTKAIKISAIAFNIIFGILGVLLIIGASFSFNIEKLENSTRTTSYVVGVLIIIFAVFGCLAALRESLNLALFCTFFFLGLAISHIVLVCIDYSNTDLHEGLNEVNKAWYNATKMDEIQIKYKCCGKGSAQDYIYLSKDVPSSCYAAQDRSTLKNLFMTGCSSKVQDHHESNITKMLIIQWVLIAFELIGFFLHLYLFINFRNKQRRLQF